MRDPIFSVVIAAGDDAPLEATLASLHSQWFGDWEAIIVVYGPAQSNLTPALRLAERVVRLRVLSEPASGRSAARTIGAAYATADLLAFLDAGDIWPPGTLGTCHTLFAGSVGRPEATASPAVIHGRVVFGESDLASTGRMSPRPLALRSLATLLGVNPLGCASNLVMRRSVFTAVGGFDESLDLGAEQEWLFRAHRAGIGPILGINVLLAVHRAPSSDPAELLAQRDRAWREIIARAAQTAPRLVEEFGHRVQALHLRGLACEALSRPSTCAAAAPLVLRAVAADWSLLLQEPRTLGLLCAALLVRLAPSRRFCVWLGRLTNG